MTEIDSGTLPGKPATSQTTTQKRDASGVTRSTTVTSGQSAVSTTTDEQNRVTAVSAAVGGTTYSSALGYDTNSDLTSAALKTGSITVTEGLSYDNSSRLQQLSESEPTGVSNPRANPFTYDGLNRTSMITVQKRKTLPARRNRRTTNGTRSYRCFVRSARTTSTVVGKVARFEVHRRRLAVVQRCPHLSGRASS
jgi:hypothetical protein